MIPIHTPEMCCQKSWKKQRESGFVWRRGVTHSNQVSKSSSPNVARMVRLKDSGLLVTTYTG